SVTVE
ncbi:glutamine-fructose-6-phosphate transaminase, partial [Chlamydia psittaci 06-1683]